MMQNAQERFCKMFYVPVLLCIAFFARLFSNHHSLVYSFYIYSVHENEVVSNSWAVKKNKGTTSRKLQNVGEMKATLAHNEKEERKKTNEKNIMQIFAAFSTRQ